VLLKHNFTALYSCPLRLPIQFLALVRTKVPSMIFLMLFAVSCVDLQAQVDVKPAQEKQIWAMKSASTKVLADKVDGEWFGIRPPKQYRRVELDTTAYKKAGIKVAAWSKDSVRSIKPTITVMSLPESTVPSNNDKEFLEGLLVSLTARWPDAISKGIKQGSWDGRVAYRIEFEASGKEDEIRGIAYAIISPTGTLVVSAIHPNNSSEDREAFKVLGQAVLSCKFK
jgi:hypothetical protein